MNKIKKSYLKLIHKTSSGKALYQCECGTRKELFTSNVNRLHTTSCGCRQKEIRSELSTIHGMAKHPLYKTWKSIKNRCYNKNDKSYTRYGGRGISICKEWSNPVLFIDWAELNGYKKGLQIDRKNNSGNYEPGNCRFVTCKVNANNKRNNRLLEHNGKTQTVSQWADQIGISSRILSNRINTLKWSIQKTLTTAPRYVKHYTQSQIFNEG